jgi:hypothetical protein
MFLAAFTSALQAKPQAVHTKRGWLSRDFASTCPHAERRQHVDDLGTPLHQAANSLAIDVLRHRCLLIPAPA